MSRNTIVVLIYHHYELLDLISYLAVMFEMPQFRRSVINFSSQRIGFSLGIVNV
jgi:hypothetical protein